MIKQSIDADLKQALLSGDKELATTLRTIKSVILDAEVASGKRDTGLDDETIVGLLIKENKKRQDASDLYSKANDQTRAQKELTEIDIIAKYLPTMMSEEEIGVVVDEVIASMSEPSLQQMGQVIGAVKAKAGQTADGGTIAKIVKEKLS